jgi:hypothetical protein
MNKILSVAALMMAIQPSFAGTERGGGDPVGLDFQAEAAKAVTKITQQELGAVSYSELIQKLESAKYIVVDQALNLVLANAIQNSAAENEPSTSTIYINRARWQAITDEASRQSLAAHELLSLIGVESSGDYHVSKNLKIDASQNVTLLYSEYFDPNSSVGLTDETAVTQCSNEKSLFEEKYYFVYCTYLEKNAFNADGTPTATYGLNVYGVGESGSLSWHTVFSSKSFGSAGQFSDEFANSDDAQEACNLEIAAGNPAWTQPRCVIEADGTQFYYEIQTQNPLLNPTENL